MDACREKFTGGASATNEAFEELCAMVGALHEEKEAQRENARARFERQHARNLRLRTKNQRLRAKYIFMCDAYNTLAEEAHERSDSSSGSDSDDDDNCCIM